MKRIFKTFFVSIALLFSVQSAHAVSFPIADANYGVFLDLGSIDLGGDSGSLTLEDLDPNAAWFKFTISVSSNYRLSTEGSDISDTILALYDDDGNRLDQNYDCDFANGVSTSCLNFSGIAGTMYYAGVSEEVSGNTNFLDDWGLFNYSGIQDEVTFTISAVPVPAAIWLFGTALIGFVGLSRRRSVKS